MALPETPPPIRQAHFLWFVAVAASCVAALLYWSWGDPRPPASTERAVREFHRQFNDAEFARIYAQAQALLRDFTTEEQLTGVLRTAHEELGTVRKTRLVAWHTDPHDVHHPYAPSPLYTLIYSTTFDRERVDEQFRFYVEGDRAILMAYFNLSDALLAKVKKFPVRHDTE